MAKQRRSRPPSAARSRSRTRAPFVLVVDDTPDNREMYMEYLRFAGFRVEGAADGESAIEAARSLRPAVILMDLSLPGIDGWEATRILKADPETRDICIIAVTGHADAACRARALLVGCDFFLAKPTTPAELTEHIVRFLDRAAKRESYGEPRR